MTNRIALFLGLAIVAAVAVDWYSGLTVTIFLARKMLELVIWMAFWR